MVSASNVLTVSLSGIMHVLLYFALISKNVVKRQACSIICATILRRKPEYENITL